MIYLDHHATTPCDPRVVEAMLPYFLKYFGNASSAHEAGTQAANAVETAREQVAALLGAEPSEIIWTSGATEANNIAIFGLARGPYAQRLAPKRRRIVTTAIEHKAVLEPCRALQEEGFEVIVLPVEPDGRVNIQAAREAIDENTLLVSIQAANGEVGTIQPVAEIAALAHEVGALVHCDAAQAVGKIPVDVSAWDLDMLSFSGHKIYGPKGVGALYIRRGLASQLAPLQRGGGQERGLRPGTLPVPLLVALGEACQLCEEEILSEANRLAALRDELEAQLQEAWPSVRINGAHDNRLPHNSSLTFPSIEADALLANLPNIALSTGSACESGAIEPSKVLLAVGLSRSEATSSLRVGLGRFTHCTELEEVVLSIANACHLITAGNASVMVYRSPSSV
jgi:cysteine desulfurase